MMVKARRLSPEKPVLKALGFQFLAAKYKNRLALKTRHTCLNGLCMAGIYHKATKRVLVIIDAIPVTITKPEAMRKPASPCKEWLLESRV